MSYNNIRVFARGESVADFCRDISTEKATRIVLILYLQKTEEEVLSA